MKRCAVSACWIAFSSAAVFGPAALRQAVLAGRYGGPVPAGWLEVLLQLSVVVLPVLVQYFPGLLRWKATIDEALDLLRSIAAALDYSVVTNRALDMRIGQLLRALESAGDSTQQVGQPRPNSNSN